VSIAVAATGSFGAGILDGLAARREIELVITRPDSSQGRGRKKLPPPAKEVAAEHGIDIQQPDRLTEFPGEALIVIVADYGVLIPEKLLSDRLWLNVHPSLLPRWRGPAPVERAIMAGDRETGVTIHRTTSTQDQSRRNAASRSGRRTTPTSSSSGRPALRSSCSTRSSPSRPSSRSPRSE
jgi:methionyl-tRNA formyltransferase